MFEAYKVAVRLSLVSNVATGLVALSQQFQKLNRHVNNTQGSVNQLERKLLQIKRLGLIGGGMFAAGSFGLAAFRGPLDEAKKFQTEVTKFASLGFGDAVNSQAIKYANGMNTFGTSTRENLSLMSDAMAIFKDLGHAKFAAPIMAKMMFANKAVFGSEGGEMNGGKFMDMMKVIEFRGGLNNRAEFHRQANYVQQVISGSRNRVDASQLLQALKTGGVGLSQRSNEQFYLGSEPLIQEFGGQRYGTGAMSIYQNLVQARGTITAQQELYRLGLLDRSKVTFNKLGMLKKALPGAFKGSVILEKEGELALLEKVLLPAFANKGITNDEGIIREIGMILGNRTGSSLMSRIYQQRATIHKQSEANRNALNIDQLDARGRTTLAGKEIELQAKWRDALKDLGTTVLPIAIRGVEALTSVLRGTIKFSKQFPTFTKSLVVGFGVLSGIVAVGGVLALTTASFRALGLVLAFTPLGGATGLVSIAGSIASIGKAIVGMSLSFMTNPYVLGVLAAGAAGYGVGTLLNKGIDKGLSIATGHKTTLGSSIYDWTHPEQSFNTVKSSGQKMIQVHTQLNVDGRKQAESVSMHQAKAASKPFGGQSVFDMSMSPLPAGMKVQK